MLELSLSTTFLSVTMVATAFNAAATAADDTLGVQRRQFLAADAITDVASPLFKNPALMPLYSDVSLGNAQVFYHHRHGSLMALEFDPDMGLSKWGASAEALMHMGEQAVWGRASYDNGKMQNRMFCLSSDYQFVYPYVNATPSGGDMKNENYCFKGGWGAPIAHRWRMGATLGYDAGNAYRQVDPRPRNITGNLKFGVGASYTLSDSYIFGVDASLRRYTQSNSIIFESEMGQETIYHLTGLATQYQRFAGLGSKMSYTAYEPGLAFQLFPSQRKGFFLSSRYAHMNMRCVLNALNSLPMASVRYDGVEVTGGWLGKYANFDFGAFGSADYSSRNGIENIFGDPVSSVFPKIGSQKMYVDNRAEVSVGVYGRKTVNNWYLQLQPSLTYLYDRETYDISERILQISRLQPGILLQGALLPSKSFFTSINIAAYCYVPTDCSITMPSPANDFYITLQSQQRAYYAAASSSAQEIKVEWKASYALSSSYALGLSVNWDYLHSSVGYNYNQITTALQFYF